MGGGRGGFCSPEAVPGGSFFPSPNPNRPHRAGSRAMRAVSRSLMVALVAISAVAQAQPTQQVSNQKGRIITPADLKAWNTIRNATLSNDGKWFAYVVAPAEGDATLVLEEHDRRIEGNEISRRRNRRRHLHHFGRLEVDRLHRRPTAPAERRGWWWPRRSWWRRSKHAGSCRRERGGSAEQVRAGQHRDRREKGIRSHSHLPVQCRVADVGRAPGLCRRRAGG